MVSSPRAIIGLGNPGPRFETTRHNAGFLVLDALADRYGGVWNTTKNTYQVAQIQIAGQPVLLYKPQTFMNCSGDVVPALKMKGIEPDRCVVVHDELEKPPGTNVLRMGGSARGHNGLRSLIERWGTKKFTRLRFGIGRPAVKAQVGSYVLEPFEDTAQLSEQIDDAVRTLEQLYEEPRL